MKSDDGVLTRSRFDFKVAVMVLDNAKTDRQAEAGPFFLGLGREKRLKHLLANLIGYADALVLDVDANPALVLMPLKRTGQTRS